MFVVTPESVTPAAFRRMQTDHVIAPLSERLARPQDVVLDASWRAATCAALVPRKAALSGLAGLWVWGLPATGGRDSGAPRAVEVAVPRGTNPDPPQGLPSTRWRCVTDPYAWSSSVTIGLVPIASPAACIAAALRRADLADAMVATWVALSCKIASVRTIEAAMSSHSRRGQGFDRMRVTWGALRQLHLERASEDDGRR